jgi:hypothetical protein
VSQLARNAEGSKVPRYRLLILILLEGAGGNGRLAAFGGDFDALVALVDAVVLCSDFGGRRRRRPQDHP